MSLRLIRGLALVAFAAGLPLAASAQVIPQPPANGPAGAPQQGGHHRGNPYMRAVRSLSLNDSQKSQIQSIVQSYRQKNQGVDRTTRRANTRQMRSDIMNVLTPAQRTQLQQQMQQYRNAQPSGQGAPR
jgi:Spy/CpxP family protein refolding chaperone